MAPGIIAQAADFVSFDYSKSDTFGVPWFIHFMSPTVAFGAVALYLLISKPIFAFIRDALKIESKSPALKMFIIMHSGLLAVYSAWTCYYSVKIVGSFMLSHGGLNITGMNAALCDYDGSLWNQNGFGFWVAHFYISKLYEFIDSWILVVKGQPVSFLQTFHHAGIVLSMWGFTTSSASVVAVIVCLNSFIHTLMYTYYVLAAFGYRSPLKTYLTQAQILQFILGLTMSFPTHFIPNCLSGAQSFVLGVTQIYTVILIILFMGFYMAAYKKPVGGQDKKKK